MSEVQILYYNEPNQGWNHNFLFGGKEGGGGRLNYHINLQFKKNSSYYISIYTQKLHINKIILYENFTSFLNFA